MNCKQFYAYIYLDELLIPYYVGKGCRNRATADHGRIPTPPKDRIQIVLCPSEEIAFAYEVLLISTYGRINLGTGSLLNVDEGGTGPAKRNCSAGGKVGGKSKSKAKLDQFANCRVAGTLAAHSSEWVLTGGIRREALRGVHFRHHVGRGIVKEGCVLCQS